MVHTISLSVDEANAVVENRKTFHTMNPGQYIKKGDIVEFYVGVDAAPGHKTPHEIDKFQYYVTYIESTPFNSYFCFSQIVDDSLSQIPFDKRLSVPEGVFWPRYADGRLVRIGDDTHRGHVYSIQFTDRQAARIITSPTTVSEGVKYVLVEPYETLQVPSVRVHDDNKNLYKPVKVGDHVFDVATGEDLEYVDLS